MPRNCEPLLEVSDVVGGYGLGTVLHGVSLSIHAGEVVALIGRNGMGKTTTVMTIMGHLPQARGAISFAGESIMGRAPYRIARAGLALVPEGRRIFTNLTTRENLLAFAANRSGAAQPWTLDAVLDLFPRLGQRLGNYGNQLSGGEQQMLAIGRALMTNPRLLILDEATEGLAPVVREEIWACIRRLRHMAQSIIVIDKNIPSLLNLADFHYILEKGAVAWSGTSKDLKDQPALKARYLSA